MQRTGRKGHAQFRVIVQDAHRHPSSGNIVASLGHYDPHTKAVQLEKEKASFYLEHGAQPSDRVARLLKSEGVKLPKWVEIAPKKKSTIRNPEKLRKNRPAGAEAPPTNAEKAAAAAEETTPETVAATESAAPAPETAETKDAPEAEAAVEEKVAEADESKVEEKPEETPAEPELVKEPEVPGAEEAATQEASNESDKDSAEA